MRIVPEIMSVRITDVLRHSLPVVQLIVIVESMKSVSMVTVKILVMLPMLVEPMLNAPFSTTAKHVLVLPNSLATLRSNAFVFPMVVSPTISVPMA